MAETISASSGDRETSMPWLILSCKSNNAAKESAALSTNEVPRDFFGEDGRGVLSLAVRSLRLLFFFSAAGASGRSSERAFLWEHDGNSHLLYFSPPLVVSSSVPETLPY